MLIRLAQALSLASLAWGSFAFAGTYTWASQPLAAGCAASGLLACAATRRARVPLVPVTLGLVLLLAAIALQLVPLPVGVLARISPASLDAIARLDVVFAATGATRHPLSIAPGATRHALLLAACFALLMVGLARLTSVTGTRWLLIGITALTVLLSLSGLMFDPGKGGKALGFWTPMMAEARPFGPFINRNHFGGWALMALPLALALFASQAERARRLSEPGVRARLIWLGTGQGTGLILLGIAAAVIAFAMLMTMSRSAHASFVVALVVGSAFVARRMRSRTSRLLGIGALAVFGALAFLWVGGGNVVARFEAIQTEDVDSRLGAWRDAVAVAREFPLTGTGLNTYGTAMLLFQRNNLRHHYAQAHNDYLQLAAEGGALLVAPAVALIVLFALAVRRRFRDRDQSDSAWWARAGALTGLAGIACQEAVEFSLQMPANAALFAVLCAIALHSRVLRTGRADAPPA